MKTLMRTWTLILAMEICIAMLVSLASRQKNRSTQCLMLKNSAVYDQKSHVLNCMEAQCSIRLRAP